MKTLNTTIVTVIVLAFAAAVTASPASDMKIVASDGAQGFTTICASDAPAGSYVEATVELDGMTVTLDMACVCPETGFATVAFAGIGEDPRVTLKSGSGAVLFSSYVGGLEGD